MFEPVRMGWVLALVSAGLVFFMVALLAAVYFTRDEDNFQADNLLAEEFTKEVARVSQEGGGELNLRDVASFPWDRALLVAPGTPREAISRRLGREWTGIDTVDGGDLLIFLRGDEVVRFADYRGNGRFEGFSRPFAELPPVLNVDALVIRP